MLLATAILTRMRLFCLRFLPSQVKLFMSFFAFSRVSLDGVYAISVTCHHQNNNASLCTDCAASILDSLILHCTPHMRPKCDFSVPSGSHAFQLSTLRENELYELYVIVFQLILDIGKTRAQRIHTAIVSSPPRIEYFDGFGDLLRDVQVSVTITPTMIDRLCFELAAASRASTLSAYVVLYQQLHRIAGLIPDFPVMPRWALDRLRRLVKHTRNCCVDSFSKLIVSIDCMGKSQLASRIYRALL